MIAMDLHPLSIVTDEGFVQFARLPDKKYQLLSRAALIDILLPSLFEQ